MTRAKICKDTRGGAYAVDCANEKRAGYIGGKKQGRRVMGQCPYYPSEQASCPLYRPKV
jgi:hypothetical protein